MAKPPLEKVTEDKCRLYALNEHNVKSIKLNLMGNRSWPDRIFLMPDTPWWVEFKREGEKPTPMQMDTNKYLGSLRYDASIIYTHAEFVREFNRRYATEVDSKGVHEKSRQVPARKSRGRSPT